jgi:2'-5' RNA ligase
MARCFLGFELTEGSRAYLRARLEPLHRELARERHWPVRLVPPDNWHATLLFFPGLTESEREEVWTAVQAAAGSGAWNGLAFPWQGLALWPSPRRPALVCLEAPLHEPARGWPLLERLGEPPFAKGEVEHLRDYRPHLTLMRFRRGRGARLPRPRDWEAVRPLLPALEAEEIRFDRVSFFLSTVTPERPIYPRERSAPLGG